MHRPIPDHDILCAGFPCQPFSKAGEQQGFECPKWGDLFDYVIRILRAHKPRYFIIENVPNLVRHRQGQTWKTLKHRLRRAGYSVREKLLSPDHFGVPQIRERVFIVGRRGGLQGLACAIIVAGFQALYSFPFWTKIQTNRDYCPERFIGYLEAWQKFLDLFPKHEQLPSSPIWAMEFGATYPYADKSPVGVGLDAIGACRGSFGHPLASLKEHAVVAVLPPYARDTAVQLPKWKIKFIRQNRDLYKRHKTWIDEWLPSILEFSPSFQKLEWNCKGEERDIWKYIIQFRASGIRVKRPATAPSLVAMTTSPGSCNCMGTAVHDDP